MDRILRGTLATASVAFYDDGIAVDPGVVTVTVASAAGESLTGGTATGSGAAARGFTLSAAHTALLDTLTLSWASPTKGTLTTVVEVVGGFLFSVAEARALSPLDDAAKFTTADIVATRTGVEQAIEQACGCAFVPRFARETLDGTGGRSLLLSRPLVTLVRSVTVAGSAFSVGDLAGLAVSPAGVVYSTSRSWGCGYSNVTVGYEHGYQDAPAEIRRAALLLAKMWLTERRSPIDDRAITFSAGEGGTYSLAVPGRNGSHFGHPDVDAAIDRYSLVTGVA